MAQKRINPRKKPVNAADLKKAKSQACDKAIRLCQAIHMTVLLDKFGFDADEICRFFHEIEYLSDSINRGYVDVRDLVKVLKDEYEIDLMD